MRTLRARAAFPAEVHVEAFAPPPRDKLREISEVFGLGKTRITHIDQPARTYTITVDPIKHSIDARTEKERAEVIKWWERTVAGHK